MMSRVWVTIPSARPNGGTLKLWKQRGYMLAVFRNPGQALPFADIQIVGDYKGYPAAVNHLIRTVATQVSDATWFVIGGDDVDPDPNRNPDDVAEECEKYFGGTFGVMQPTGDRWCIDKHGTCSSERVCDTAWIGRDFALRMYGGRGPLCEEYFHFFCDEELHEVAQLLGVLWHRSDIFQHHHHWMREGKRRPQHLHPARLNWAKAKELFNDRKARGFPGHQPLPAPQVSVEEP